MNTQLFNEAKRSDILSKELISSLLAGYGFALHRAYRSLDGMNGDISGYALTLGELCAIAVYALI